MMTAGRAGTQRSGAGGGSGKETRTDVPVAVAVVTVTAGLLTVHVQSVLSTPALGEMLLSGGLYRSVRLSLSGFSSFLPLFGVAAALCLVFWLAGATLLWILTKGMSWRSVLVRWGLRFLWLDLLGLFELLWSVGGWLPAEQSVGWLAVLAALLPFFHSVAVGGLVASAVWLGWRPVRQASGPGRRAVGGVLTAWSAALLFAAVFGTLSVLQYRALMVPHGDTAMYEEHLWNLLHGKGFRSQLDGGRLFLGEHLEVIHVLLIPVYLLWPSLPTLNICLSVALGCGAVAVWGIGRGVSGDGRAAALLAVAYVLYFPLQYLNLEASLKTFRPENFGVPLLLFAIWALECGRWRTMLALLALTLLCKEDYALPAGMLGCYLLVRRPAGSGRPVAGGWRVRLLGGGLLAFAAAYLWFVEQVFIPYFRGGPPHYAQYFAGLGETPAQIAGHLVTHPAELWRRLVTCQDMLFLLSLTVPLAGLPLAGWSRLWVLLPSLLGLLVSDLEATQAPVFHFHAPLVPIVFWAAAEGLGRCGRLWSRPAGPDSKDQRQPTPVRTPATGLAESGPWPGGGAAAIGATAATLNLAGPPVPGLTQSAVGRWAVLAVACALVSGFWFGKSPLSLSFYDPYAGLQGYWRTLYVPTARVEAFRHLYPLIPRTASVAATDFVRPRFTHHRLCHQYGEGGLKPHVSPDQVDYIVLDLMAPYSDPVQARRIGTEWSKRLDQWQVIYDDLRFFIVVQRIAESTGPGADRPAARPGGAPYGSRAGRATPGGSGPGGTRPEPS